MSTSHAPPLNPMERGRIRPANSTRIAGWKPSVYSCVTLNGRTMQRPSLRVEVEDLALMLPTMAYCSITVREQTYWCFTLGGCIAGLGQALRRKRCRASSWAALVTACT